MAGGYNSYHEAIAFALPTLFIPNLDTGMDDQLARVKAGQDANACLVLEEDGEVAFKESILKMLNSVGRKEIKDACEHMQFENGAEKSAASLIDWI